MNFTGFLGKLGVDPKLLIAQLINFGLLLWILKRFLYKPIIRRIEQDEQELNEAQKQKIILVKAREDFATEQKNKNAALLQQTKKTVQEAETVAKNITDSARGEQEQIKQQIIGRAESAMKSKKKGIEEDLKSQIAANVRSDIMENLSVTLVGSEQKKFDGIFFSRMLEALRNEVFAEALPKISSMSDELAVFEKRSGKNKKAIEEKLRELAAEKIGPARLEYASDISRGEESRLLEVLEKKLSLPKALLTLEKEKNPDLVSGFRLEILGRIFEQNFLYIINYAEK